MLLRAFDNHMLERQCRQYTVAKIKARANSFQNFA